MTTENCVRIFNSKSLNTRVTYAGSISCKHQASCLRLNELQTSWGLSYIECAIGYNVQG